MSQIANGYPRIRDDSLGWWQLIERGRGTGPLKPRQPSPATHQTRRGESVPNPSRGEIRHGGDEKEES